MKKILAIILVLCSVFAMFSCDDGEIGDTVATISSMYAVSTPTKIATTSKTTMGNVELDGTYTLVTGKVNGKVATVSLFEYEEIASIDEGSGEVITGAIKTVKGSKGVRENGGSWTDGYNFAPVAGDIAINLDMDNLTDVLFENNVLTFSVAADKTAAVFGENNAIDADVSVTITNDGAVITGITMQYTLEASGDYPEAVIVITTSYEYDIQEVTLTK